MLNRLKSSVIPLTIAAAALIFASSVLAQDANKPSATRVSQASPAGKLRSCQAREAAIKKRAERLTALVNNMIQKFDRHALQVETFYTTKLVPKGKIVANYNALVADINAKKAAAQAALAKAQNDASSFSCANADPKAQMTQYRQDMQATKQALKDYRTAVKNLIVAVRSVTGGEATGSGAVKK